MCFIANPLRDHNHAECHGQWQHHRQSGQRRHHGCQQLGDGAYSPAGGPAAEQLVQRVRHERCGFGLALQYGPQLVGGYNWQRVYGTAQRCRQVSKSYFETTYYYD